MHVSFGNCVNLLECFCFFLTLISYTIRYKCYGVTSVLYASWSKLPPCASRVISTVSMPLRDCIVFFLHFPPLYGMSMIFTQSSQASHDHEGCVCDEFLKQLSFDSS